MARILAKAATCRPAFWRKRLLAGPHSGESGYLPGTTAIHAAGRWLTGRAAIRYAILLESCVP